MNIAKQTLKMTSKTCAYSYCTNTFTGSQFQRYCNDPRCKELRQLERNKDRQKKIDNDADNRIIAKVAIKRALEMKKKVVTLKCKAKNAKGNVCGKQFNVELDLKRAIYPKYCELHANAYKRKRYMLSRENTCQR